MQLAHLELLRAQDRAAIYLAKAAIAVLKTAGRPMHGLREILPALEAQGYKIKHRAGFATVILRTKKARRTAPGTFVYDGGATGN